MNEIYALDGSFQDLISHTLCLDHLVHYNELVCKDLGLLVQNRTIDLSNDEDYDEIEDACEIIVIDVAASVECLDPQCDHINFLQGPVYDGSISY